ncbi:TVP38/TMEM64 family protein [Humisphaera borealis]|uniref:TVP38/TMEM64 family membrane protein n=1 Tax=Humisphaera borealis TaxID=2807512 RepID=A0A7M2WWJ2_9BACT|nr:VTT domain-containing protein [Humisphaera borealis]QOV88880.1 TVP38/TMEM64 family protein [Humisphaera borealis]
MPDPQPLPPAPALDDQPPTPPPPLWTLRGIRRLGAAGLMGVISLAVPPIGAALLAYLTAHTTFAEVLRDHAWGPYLSAVGFGLLGGFALLPTAALAIFAGWAFHFQVGLPVAVFGFTIASAIGFTVAGRFSGTTVVDLIDKSPRWKAVHIALLHSSALRTFLIVILLRIPSVPPFAMTNVALATLRVRFLPFLLGTAIGVVPRTAAYVWLASRAEKLESADTGGWKMLVISIAVTLAVLVVITVLARRALERVTGGNDESRKTNDE